MTDPVELALAEKRGELAAAEQLLRQALADSRLDPKHWQDLQREATAASLDVGARFATIKQVCRALAQRAASFRRRAFVLGWARRARHLRRFLRLPGTRGF